MNELRPVVIGHVPVDFGYPLVFVNNLLRFKHRYPIILFTARTDLPAQENVTIITVPDAGKQELGACNVTNLVWLTACRIAFVRGQFTHMIYLEEDCRVGCDEWDAVMFDEYVALAGQHVHDSIGGTPMCFGEHGLERLAPKQWQGILAQNVRRNFPVPTYGAARSNTVPTTATCVTVCGALGIYSRSLILELFDLEKTTAMAKAMSIWDFELGWRMWKRFHVAAFEHVIYLHSMLSSYDLTLSTEDERRQMLMDGLKVDNGATWKVVAVHKIKSDWPGPTSSALTAPGTLATPPRDAAIVASGELTVTTPEAGAVAPMPLTAKPIMQSLVDDHLHQIKKEMTPMQFHYRVDILIVTHAKDSKWLAMALKSIGKFCRGFGEIFVVFPKTDIPSIHPVLEDPMTDPWFPFDIRPVVFDQAEGKGHLHHMVQKCMADLHCPDADLILHWDSDLIAHAPITPLDYMHRGEKPILLMTPYERLRENNRVHYIWKHVTEQALKEPVHYSCMERMPILHWRELYPLTRQIVETKQAMTLEAYFLSVSPVFPHGVCDFVLLGAVALRTAEMVERYKFVNLAREAKPPDLAIQFSSQGLLDEPQEAPSMLPAKYPIEPDGTVVPRLIINDILEIK